MQLLRHLKSGEGYRGATAAWLTSRLDSRGSVIADGMFVAAKNSPSARICPSITGTIHFPKINKKLDCLSQADKQIACHLP